MKIKELKSIIEKFDDESDVDVYCHKINQHGFYGYDESEFKIDSIIEEHGFATINISHK